MSHAINLSALPPPSVIEPLDFETIFSTMLDDLRARDASFDALVESDPAYKILEVAAYRELLLRQRINDASCAVLLAYAQDSDLEHLAALLGVVRLIETNEDDEVTFRESDEDLRRRITESMEGFSTAGPIGAYHYHGMSSHADVKDISVTSPHPGDVLVTVLSREDDGVASAALLATVEEHLSADSRRPLTDHVMVQAAELVRYDIEASLVFYPGPDVQVTLAEAIEAVTDYAAQTHRLGQTATLSGIYAALHRPGVQKVTLSAPDADVSATLYQAPFCSNIVVVDGGLYDNG